MSEGQPQKKKLIEVALPLNAINKACSREKSIRHGHPSTLHLWWARRPLAAARAVIFSQMVDDPSSYPDLFPTEKAQLGHKDVKITMVYIHLLNCEPGRSSQSRRYALRWTWRSYADPYKIR